MLFLAYLIGFLCLTELLAYVYLVATRQPTHPVILNMPLIKKQLSFRKVVLNMVMRHYMVRDANLGYRFKANTKPFRLLHRLPGNKKRFKEVNIKNFFEMRTDDYGFISNTQEQKRDYSALANDKSVYKILVCGASVSAGYGTPSGEYNWPSLLEQALNQDKSRLPAGYHEVAVINSSSLGSFPAQELRRFQDETIFLNPDTVILFSAGSIEYDYHGNPVDIGFHAEQKRMNEVFNRPWYARYRYVLPNLFECVSQKLQRSESLEQAYAFRRKGFVNISAAQHIISKVRQFKGTCDTHNINFEFILQPGMGPGEKVLTKQEQNLIKHFERYFFEKNWEEYVRVFNAYLAELRPYLTESYQHDFMNIFKDVAETVYCDPRHQNELGHQILADKIESIIRMRWGQLPAESAVTLREAA